MSRWLTAKEKQLSDVEPKHSTPKDLFTKPASTIVRVLLQQTKGNVGKAIQKITFYINRAGENLSNKVEVNKAKNILKKRLENEKD